MDRSSGSGGAKIGAAIVSILFGVSTIADAQNLRIDSQLRIPANDCYTRIAIGSRLPIDNGTTTLSVASLTDCESACSANRTRCNAFSFGVDSRGNASCAIGNVEVPYSKLADLKLDPDYDVYERRTRTPWGCSGNRHTSIGYVYPGAPADQKVPKFGNLLNGWTVNASNAEHAPSFVRGGWYWPHGDDADIRLYDLLNDRHRPSSPRPMSLADLCADWHLVAFCRSKSRDVAQLARRYTSRNSAMNENGYRRERYRSESAPESPALRTTPFGTSPTLGKWKACYRKLLAGKRLLDNHVRRDVACYRIEDCYRLCEHESTFVCEGFNYGEVTSGSSHGRSRDGERGYVCQLTSVSGIRMDPRRDFVDDARYDYYARDWTCPAGKVDPFEMGWSEGSPVQRPKWIPISPPAASPSRLPLQPPLSRDDTRSYYPQERYIPLGNRAVDHYGTNDGQRPWSSYLPQRTAYDGSVHRVRPSAIQPAITDDSYNAYYYGEPIDPLTRRMSDSRRYRPPGRNDVVRSGLPVYSGSYGSGKNRYPNDDPRAFRDHYDAWTKTPGKTSAGDQRDRHYGQNYSPAYGYHPVEDVHSGRTGWKPDRGRPSIGSTVKECSVRSLMGFKVTRRIIVASHVTANVAECEMLCTARGDCFSFAYRYFLVATAPTDNCLLSNVPFERLNFYTDLVPDRDYDIYAIVADPRDCYGNSAKPGTEQIDQPRRSSEECFWRVRNGCGMPRDLTRKKIRVGNGLGECQIACISARQFTCRSFVFRYESYDESEANCFLSDCSTREIIRAIESEDDWSIGFRDAELYERGSYGRGCEAYPFAPIYNSASLGVMPMSGLQAAKPEGCWSDYQASCKLSPSAVASITRVDSEKECRRQCSKMLHNPHLAPCRSFSFRIGDGKHGDNCYLSDVPRRDLRPGIDYTHDNDYVMYAWKELEPQCSPVHGQDDSNDGRFDYVTGGEDYRPGSSPGDPLVPFANPGTSFDGHNTLFLGTRPLDSDGSDRPKFPEHSPGSSYSPNHVNGAEGPFSGPDYLDGFGTFNRHYTVNGYPCKRGTKCQINRVAGFWSCEPEGAEFGSWDYCCEPNHHCGFSQGYSYPWCYVGATEEQWRPCSDKYYPYLPSPRPAIDKAPHINDYHHDAPHYEQRNDEGRHWPIAFLHPVPPPNATSVNSIAHDRRDNDSNNLVHVNNSVGNESRASRIVRVNRTTHETLNSTTQPRKSYPKRRGLSIPVKNVKKPRHLDESHDPIGNDTEPGATTAPEIANTFIATENLRNDTSARFARVERVKKIDYAIAPSKDEKMT